MRRAAAVRAALSVLLATVLCSSGNFGAHAAIGTLELIQVQVMHRHGARYSIVDYNASLVCGSADKCGELNDMGKDMLVSVGSYLRQQYGAQLNWPTGYSQYVSYTRSTDLDRTIQSAVGLLKGLFPNTTGDNFFPVVNTVEFSTDLLLLVDAQMSYTIPKNWNMAPGFDLPAEFFSLISAADLNALGEETHQQLLCNMTTFTGDQIQACALRVQDIAASWNAEGRIPAGSKLETLYANLSSLRRMYNTQLYVYNPSNDVMRERGNLGFNLASRISSMMYAAANNTAPLSMPYTFFEWSAHDTTYMPLASALGYNNENFMLPLFGESFIFELYVDRSATEFQNKYFVKIFGGHPGQQPGSHAFAPTELPVTGMTPGGAVYNGSGTTPMSLEAFSRFINSSAPQSWRGSCYLSKDVLKKIDCEAIGAPSNPGCSLLRQSCPGAGCPSDYVMNLGDYSCVSTKPHELMSTGDAVLMVIVTALAGIMFGAAAGQMIRLIFGRFCKRSESEYSEVDH